MSDSLIKSITAQEYGLFKYNNAMFICTADKEYTFISANSVCLRLLGYSRRELKQQFDNKALRLIHPDDREDSIKVVQDQLGKQGERTFNIKLRVNSKNNGYYMVDFSGRLFDRDGETFVAVGVSSGIRQLHFVAEMHSMEDFMNKVRNLTEDNFFEYDIQNDTMICSGMFAKRFDLPEVINNFADLIRNSNIVDAISREDVSSKNILSVNGTTVSKKIKLKDNANNNYWYMVHYRVYPDADGKAARVIGKMNDITIQQNEIEKLTKLSETDSLTGLYNRSSTEHLIKETLRQRRDADGGHTLMIIDIDNFKEVNDNIGHMYGDAVLTQLSDSLTEIFRSDDIIGRLGGDEFFVLVKNCFDDDVLADKAMDICKAFEKTYHEVGAPVTISASIGIAKSPEHAQDFETLYQYADIALYSVKAGGKNGYAIYSKDMGKPVYTSTRTELDSENNTALSLYGNRLEFFIRMFQDSADVAIIMPAALKLLAEQYSFSKSYIFELTDDKQSLKKTFSWDNEEEFGYNSILNNFPMHDFAESMTKSLSHRMFVMNTIDDLANDREKELISAAGIKSLLLFSIVSKGEMVGFVGYENSKVERKFDTNFIEELGSLSSIVATFLLNYRLEKLLES